MNRADDDRILELCALIAVERDPENFQGLIEELNLVLSIADDRSETIDLPARGRVGERTYPFHIRWNRLEEIECVSCFGSDELEETFDIPSPLIILRRCVELPPEMQVR